jgi:O-antigen ligase|tara:strand:- start:2263 stop:3579 length:1317 start_codon:yes stop_codon:yes gene_type:complete
MLLTNEKNIDRFIVLTSILFCLLPFAQISGPLFTDAFISIISLIYLYLIYFLNRNLHKSNFFLYLLFLFWVYISIISIFSEYKNLSILPSVTFIRFIIFTYAIILVLNLNKNLLKNFNISLLIALFVLVLDGYYQYIFDINILGFEKLRPDRLSGLFLDEMVLGSFLTKILPIIFFLSYENKNFKKLKILNIIIIIIAIPLIFLSGERTAFFLIILFCLLVLPFLFNIKEIILMLIIFFSVCITVINLDKVIYGRYVNQLNDHLISKRENLNIFLPQYIGLFNSAYVIFSKNKLFGTGVKTFREMCKRNDGDYKKKIKEARLSIGFCSTHPHNYYFQFLAETGIFGFLFLTISFLICVLSYIKKLHQLFSNKIKNKLMTKKYIVLLVGSMMHVWPLSTTGSFFNNWNSSFIFLQLSLLIYFTYGSYHKNKKLNYFNFI